MPISYAPQSALDALLQRLLGNSSYNGKPLGALFDRFGAEASQKAQDALTNALLGGDNPTAVAGDLANILNISYNRAMTIARTEMLSAYRDAQLANFRANSDVVAQWMWNAAPGCCAECAAEDGSLHPLDEDMDSHPNCRCSPSPATVGWDDILGQFGIDTSDLPDTSIAANYVGVGDDA